MLTEEKLKQWQEAARRDDALKIFVPSDIREMLGDIERLRCDMAAIAALLFHFAASEGGEIREAFQIAYAALQPK